MARDWYSPGGIYFTHDTALWLIQNLGSLLSGRWPSEPSSYTELLPGKKSGRKKAYFETPIEYAAEILDRLEKCGTDGLILEALECWGKSEASMAKYFQVEERTIRARANRALAYVSSGPARRWHDTKKRGRISYREWIDGKRWDAKMGTYYWKKRRRK